MLAAVALGNAILAAAVVASGAFWWAHESGPIENAQILLLLAAAGLFAHFARGEDTPEGTINWCLALACLGFAIREVELRGTRAPGWLADAMHKGGQDVLIGATVAACLALLLVRRHHWRAMAEALRRPGVPLYAAAALLLLLGEAAETIGRHHRQYGLLLEETLELNGNILLLLAGIYFPLRAAAPAPNPLFSA